METSSCNVSFFRLHNVHTEQGEEPRGRAGRGGRGRGRPQPHAEIVLPHVDRLQLPGVWSRPARHVLGLRPQAGTARQTGRLPAREDDRGQGTGQGGHLSLDGQVGLLVDF